MSLFSYPIRKYISLMILLPLLYQTQVIATNLSSLAKNDPYPIYKTQDPQEFLNTWRALCLKGIPNDSNECCQDVSIAISPFAQNACTGKNFYGDGVPLGDLNGRWSMVGLLMGPLPEGKTLPPTLLEALQVMFPNNAPGTLDDPNIIDPNQSFGFFSVPLRYLRGGLRWDFALNIGHGFGFIFQGGIADIVQRVEGFDNLTCLACPYPANGTNGKNVLSAPYTVNGSVPSAPVSTYPSSATQSAVNVANQPYTPLPINCCNRIEDSTIPCCGRFFGTAPNAGTATIDVKAPLITKYPNYTASNVQQFLMNQLRPIAHEIGLDICNFHKVSLEDMRFEIYWRDSHLVNKGRSTWAEFLFIPYVEFGGSLALGASEHSNYAFSLPFGNNGHQSIGATGGIELDFVDTVEIGAEVGITHFFARDFCNLRIPNIMTGRQPANQCQLGIYPFGTEARVQPGLNWHFAAKLQTYHFIDRLSFYFQYIIVHHEHDRINLRRPDPAFAPCVLEEMSSFTAQMGNFSLYYDLSPRLNLGALVQLPFQQQNAYRSTTVMVSLWSTF